MLSPLIRDRRSNSSGSSLGLQNYATVRPSLSASSSQFQFEDWIQVDRLRESGPPFAAMSPPLASAFNALNGGAIRAEEREISPLSTEKTATRSASVDSGTGTRTGERLGYSATTKEGPSGRHIPQTRQSVTNRSLGYPVTSHGTVHSPRSHSPLPAAAASSSKFPPSTSTAQITTTRVTRSRRVSAQNLPSSGTNQSEAAALNLLRLASNSTSGSVIAFEGDSEEREPESDASSVHQSDEKPGGDIYRHFTNFYRDGPSPNFLGESPSYEWRSDSAMTADVLPHFDTSPNYHWANYHSSQSTNPSSQSQSSRRNSISSSVGTSMSTQRVRQHRPARTQRAVSEASLNSIELENGKRRSQRTAAKATLANSTAHNQRSFATEEEAPSPHVNKNGKRPLSPANSRTRPVRASRRLSNSGLESPASSASALPPPPAKRSKLSPAAPAPATPAPPRRASRTLPPLATTSNRTFPATVQVDSSFPRLYRDFPLSSAIPPSSPFFPIAPLASSATTIPPVSPIMDVPSDAKWNAVSSEPTNLYHPRFVVGIGDDKAGACPICIEPPERGGEAVEKWLKLKNSAYSYHMSYAHGISNVTGLPFSPPTSTRSIALKKGARDGRTSMTEGLCHNCDKWIPMLSSKNVDAVVKELIWWKHAKSCHGATSIEGETDYYRKDAIFALIHPV